ncbi:MAG: peptide deformylase [Bradymonadia bacterium]
MAKLDVLKWPDQGLRATATRVTEFDAQLHQLVDDMFETMYDLCGVGLAGTQVGVLKQVIVVDCGQDERDPLVLINPEINRTEGEIIWPEGCLSIPGVRADVTRYGTIEVVFSDQYGENRHLTATGLLAVCIQHEMDHLEGKMYFDHLGQFERRAVLNAYRDYLESDEEAAP